MHLSKAKIDMTETINWSLLQNRIGDDLNTLESSGLSSSDSTSATLELKDIFETFTTRFDDRGHLTTPIIEPTCVNTNSY
jgi:hypothetical protein